MGIYDYNITSTHYYTAAVSNYTGRAFFPFFCGLRYFIISATHHKLKLITSHWPSSTGAKAEADYDPLLAKLRASVRYCFLATWGKSWNLDLLQLG